MKPIQRLFAIPSMFSRRLPILFPVASALTLLVMAIGSEGVPAQSTGTFLPLPQFPACVEGLQGSARHLMALTEARRCEQGLPEIKRSDIERLGESDQLPSLFLAVWGSHAAIESTGGVAGPQLVSSHTPSAALATSCYNSWTSPDPSFYEVILGGNLSMSGYGNHCGYANIPSNPTFGKWCLTCTSISTSVGHADSNWDRNNYGINSALGWGNIDFYSPASGSDSFACRGWVNTSGNQSPSAWCS